MADLAEAYLLLGLRLGRLVDGLVDSYYGPAELSRAVEAEAHPEPSALVSDAEALLASLEDGWLRDQVRGLRTYAGVLAGEQLSYSDEVEGCYGVRPTRVHPDVYAEVHERLDELLAGDGSLAERYQAWVDGETVPTGRVVPALRDVVVELRDRTSELVELPDGEAVVVDEVRDEPWLAFNYYLGGLKSRVVVNVDSPSTCDDIVELAAHEVYPGHHTEHATKEQLFVREHGQLEETIKLVPTPEALVSEGLAETGPSIVLREGAIQRLEALLRRHGLDTDLGRARTIREVRRPLRRLGLDAALMIHEDGSGADEAMEHAERWGLVPPERAAQMVRFVTDPTWRAYVVNYSAGRELCADWVGGDGARFARLLTEQVRVRDLLAELSSAT